MKTPRLSFCLLLLTVIALIPGSVVAQFAAVVSAPVDHPVSIPAAAMTHHVWKTASGAWGETLIKGAYRLRGYDEVVEIKSPSGQGIDHLALKRNSAGQLVDVRFGETKTHFGGRASLSHTKHGRQLSRDWLAKKLRVMRNSGDERMRRLAREIARFRRQEGVPIESLDEWHEVDTRSGRYMRRNPITGKQLSSVSIERLLSRVQRRGAERMDRDWAMRSLSHWDQLNRTSIHSVLALHGKSGLTIGRRSANIGLARLARATVSQSVRRLAWAAGPIGGAVAVAIDADEIYSYVAAYQRGELNRRQMVTAVGISGGGIIGAGAGATAGAWIGTFGGPFAWITVPAGAMIGGMVGYIAGSTGTGAIVETWYSSLDDDVKVSVDAWIIANSYMQLSNAR
jgi:hypothetical protein